MNKHLTMFGVALMILTLITAVILGFMAGPTSPLTWLLVAILVAVPFIYKKLSGKDYIEWKDEYSVGIASIDQQHKKLINLINQLTTAVDYSTGEEFEREALADVVDYTKTHFTYEEGLLKDNGYPDFEAHRAQHKDMIAEINAVLGEYEQDHDMAIRHACNFLSGWLVNHINGTDKQYSSFLIDKGVH
jgi:hemerythrin